MNGRVWSERDLDLLTKLYPSRATKAVADRLRRPITSVYNMAAKRGLTKSQEFYESEESGRLRKGQTRPGSERTQFKKGIVPANKGLRRPGWYSGRMRETQFRKGERSGIAAINWKPIGTILTDSEGYLRIKVREAVYGKEPTGFGNVKVWPLLGRHVWERHHGPIPPSHVVVFRDRNRGNCVIENLELISRADLARRNAMWNRLPPALIEVIQLGGILKRKIREHANGKEQNR